MPSTSTTDSPLQQLKFANSNVANLVTAAATASAEALLESLEVKSCDFILLPIGAAPELPSAADAALEPLAEPLFQVLAGLGRSLVIDSGIRSWLTAPLHQRKVAKPPQVSFLGVAPAALVTYPGKLDPSAADVHQRQLDSWHSDFILVESDERWGDELPMMHAVVQALASRSAQVPVLALLAGDGPGAAEEALAAVHRGIPLAVVAGSGSLADDIVAALMPDNTEPTSELVGEIIAQAQITLLSQQNFPAEFAKLATQWLLPEEVLTQAWGNFAVFDLNAQRQQSQSDRLTFSIIALGVLGTILAISKQVVYGSPKEPFRMTFSNFNQDTYGTWLLHCSLLVIPILLTILVAAAYKFKTSAKWFVLRAGAEALKSEIYSYRARALDYQNNAATLLASRMAEIMKRTMQSEANASHLEDYNGKNGFPPYMDGADSLDKGFGYLSPERYVDVRLDDQLRYFRKRTRRLDRQLQWLYWLTLLVGGAGTLLAAISQEVWIAVTASLTGALGALLSYRQIETNLLKFNQATADLDNIKSWWKALSASEKARQSNIDFLVDRTEKTLQTELDGWVQQMKNALADLEKTQAMTAEAAQKWQPAVRFTPSEEAEKREPSDAENADQRAPQDEAVVEPSETTVTDSTGGPAPEAPAEEPAGPEPDKAPNGTPGDLMSSAALQGLARQSPGVLANGLADSPAPHPPKSAWKTADITPEVLKRTLRNLNYRWFDDQLNLIGIRTTDYKNNTFGDRLFCCWKQPNFPPDSTLLQKQKFLAGWGYKGQNGLLIVADGQDGPNTQYALARLAEDVGKDRIRSWDVTTRPGTYWLKNFKKELGGCAVLAHGQHPDAYQLGLHQGNPGHPALVQRGYLTIYRDSDRNDTAAETGKTVRGFNFGINIHRSDNRMTKVDKWSAGCQVFHRTEDHAELLRLCRQSGRKNFTYTLLKESQLV